MDVNEIFGKKLGFGAMRLPGADKQNIDLELTAKMVDSFLEKGFNYFDTAYIYKGSEEALRKCLVERHPRESFVLVDKIPTWGKKTWEDYETAFSTMLERCGVDYLDIVLLHNMGKPTYPRVMKADGFGYLRKIKEEGRAKFIGFSFHDTPEYLDEILTAHPYVDVVQLQINYVDWENPSIQSRACYEVAKKHGKPIIVMEPVKGGGLANLPYDAAQVLKGLNENASCASYAIRYAASLPEVKVVLSGMSDLQQVEDNTSYMADFAPLTEAEYAALEQVKEIMAQSKAISCTNCRYCVAGCPKKIPIPAVFSVYNAMKQYGDMNFPDMMYDRAVSGLGKASDCIQCGLCEDKCPQHLPIRELLETVKDIFEKD